MSRLKGRNAILLHRAEAERASERHGYIVAMPEAGWARGAFGMREQGLLLSEIPADCFGIEPSCCS
jgi:hypothetical protein